MTCNVSSGTLNPTELIQTMSMTTIRAKAMKIKYFKTDLEPSHIEEELEHGEERNEQIHTVTVIVLLRIQELTTK